MAAFAAASVVVAAVLWAAGFPPTQWLSALATRFHSTAEPANVDRPKQEAAAPTVLPKPIAESIPANDGTDSSLSAAPLPLYLLAVSPGRNAREGTANIGTSIDNPQSYAAGAMLVNGARLAEIHSDHVVLTRGERKARLDLYDRRNTSAKRVSDDLLIVGGARPVASPPAPTREVLVDYLRPSPVYDGDTMLGYKVYPGARGGVFSQLGLQAGDVIEAVDDMPLNEPMQAMQLLRQLTDGVALKLTIVRNQSRQHITADGSIVVADIERAEATSQQVAASPRQAP